MTFLTVQLSCPFFSILRCSRIARPIFSLCGSNDVFPRKKMLFGEVCPTPPQNGRELNRQFQFKTPKYKIAIGSPKLHRVRKKGATIFLP